MKILFDTSVLVAALVESHPAYEAAFAWLQRIKSGHETGLIAAHSIAELYAILTTLPIRPRVAPHLAQQLIQQNVLAACAVIALAEDDYAAVIEHLAEMGIAGGVTYDALILYAALKAEVDRVITLNAKDFQRIYPELRDKIMVP